MTGSNVEFAPRWRGARSCCWTICRPVTCCITMGAGDVWKAGEAVLSALRGRGSCESHAGFARLHIPQAKRSAEAGGLETWRFTPDIGAELAVATGLDSGAGRADEQTQLAARGRAGALFVVADSAEGLVKAVIFARERGVPYLVIGNGTNSWRAITVSTGW